MAFKELEYTQSVWGYQEVKRKFWQDGEIRVLSLYLRPPEARCPKCKSLHVAAYRHRDRILIERQVPGSVRRAGSQGRLQGLRSCDL